MAWLTRPLARLGGRWRPGGREIERDGETAYLLPEEGHGPELPGRWHEWAPIINLFVFCALAVYFGQWDIPWIVVGMVYCPIVAYFAKVRELSRQARKEQSHASLLSRLWEALCAVAGSSS